MTTLCYKSIDTTTDDFIISALLCSNVLYTMTSTLFRNTLLVVTIAVLASRSLAFAPNSQISRNSVASSTTPLMGIFDGEQERKSLTRDSEPEEFFATWVLIVGISLRKTRWKIELISQWNTFLSLVTLTKCPTRKRSRLPSPVSPEFHCHLFLGWSLYTLLRAKAFWSEG